MTVSDITGRLDIAYMTAIAAMWIANRLMRKKRRISSMTLSRVIRGVPVEIICSDFNADEETGLALGPDCIFATDENGEEFILTYEEEQKIAEEATDAFLNDDSF